MVRDGTVSKEVSEEYLACVLSKKESRCSEPLLKFNSDPLEESRKKAFPHRNTMVWGTVVNHSNM